MGFNSRWRCGIALCVVSTQAIALLSLIFLTMAGANLSGLPDVSVEEQVDILDEVADAANIRDQLTVCSASWGGVVAASYAVRQYKVQRLILASMGTRANEKMIEMISKGFEMEPADRTGIAETIINNLLCGARTSHAPMKRKILRQFQQMSQAALVKGFLPAWPIRSCHTGVRQRR